MAGQSLLHMGCLFFLVASGLQLLLTPAHVPTEEEMSFKPRTNAIAPHMINAHAYRSAITYDYVRVITVCARTLITLPE